MKRSTLLGFISLMWCAIATAGIIGGDDAWQECLILAAVFMAWSEQAEARNPQNGEGQ